MCVVCIPHVKTLFTTFQNSLVLLNSFYYFPNKIYFSLQLIVKLMTPNGCYRQIIEMYFEGWSSDYSCKIFPYRKIN